MRSAAGLSRCPADPSLLDHRQPLVGVVQEQTTPAGVEQALHLAGALQRCGEQLLDRLVVQSAEQRDAGAAGGAGPAQGRDLFERRLAAQTVAERAGASSARSSAPTSADRSGRAWLSRMMRPSGCTTRAAQAAAAARSANVCRAGSPLTDAITTSANSGASHRHAASSKRRPSAAGGGRAGHDMRPRRRPPTRSPGRRTAPPAARPPPPPRPEGAVSSGASGPSRFGRPFNSARVASSLRAGKSAPKAPPRPSCGS